MVEDDMKAITPLESLRIEAPGRLAAQGRPTERVKLEDVAVKLGVHKSQAGRLERGENEVRVSIIPTLAEIYGVSEMEVYEAARDTRALWMQRQLEAA